MNRRKGVIALLATCGAFVLPKKGSAQEVFMASSKPPTLQLDLERYGKDDVVIRVSLGQESVELTAKEIIEALTEKSK